jgi:hypothetical protein
MKIDFLALTNKRKIGKITTMKTQTIKIWKNTLDKLRMLHALTGESMSKIIDKLVDDELSKNRKKTSKNDW